MARFFCLWIPDFPAWAAGRNDPDLTGKPVLIFQSKRILAASPQAREMGAQCGWSVGRAQCLVPDAILRPHHAPTTEAVWQDVLATLYTITPHIESLRPGLAIADITCPEKAIPFLREWQAHGGVADDRAAAELAAFTGEAGRLRTVRPLHTPAFLRQVPMSVLKHVGLRDDILEQMAWFAWSKVGHLRPLSKKQLAAQFDQWELLHRYGQANDIQPVSTFVPPVTIESHYEFEFPVQEPGDVEPLLSLLTSEAATELADRVCQSVVVCLSTAGESLRSVRLLHEATNSPRLLGLAAQAALRELMRPGLDIARLEVQLHRLSVPQPVQGELFAPKRPSVEKAIISIQKKFPGMLKKIVMVDKNSYLPEEAFRFEPVVILPSKSTTSGSTLASLTKTPQRSTRKRATRPTIKKSAPALVMQA